MGHQRSSSILILLAGVGFSILPMQAAGQGAFRYRAIGEIRIEWPSGAMDTHENVVPGSRYLATEGGELVEDTRRESSRQRRVRQDGPREAPASGSDYYDFWIGEWYQVVDGEVAEEPRFVVESGLYPGALEEQWQMEGYRAKAWRAWDSSSGTWTFVWISERGHFQVWDERKVGDHWYMFKTFVIDGQEVLSRQAFIPREDGAVVRTSEHSTDGGESWTLRFREIYVSR